MATEVGSGTYAHDAFISYSRKNRELAAWLEKALEDYLPPKDLSIPHRHLDVFRDETDFTGAEYHRSVATHLQASAKLIVICSPARKSPYVNDEIRRFAQANGADNIVPVLLAGIPNNGMRSGQEADQAFPEALCEVLEMPLAANYLNFDTRNDKVNKGAFDGAWYTILANLCGVSRGLIEQRDRKRQARRRRIAIGVVTGVIAALLGALAVTLVSPQEAVTQRGLALERQAQAETARDLARKAAEEERKAKDTEQQQRQRADERSRVALSRQLAAEAATERRENRLDLALLLSLEARQVRVDTLEARASLLSSLEHNPRLVTVLRGDGGVSAVTFSRDGKTLAAASGPKIVIWDVASRRPIGRPFIGHDDAVFSIAFSPDVKWLVSGSRFDKNLLFWDVATARPIGPPLVGHDGAVQSVTFSPSGDDSPIVLWDVNADSWRVQACRIANRNLTYDEWKQHLGDAPYRATCPHIPVDVWGLMAAGRQLAGDGDVTGAAGVFRRLRELDPRSTLDPDIEARQVRARTLVVRGEYLAKAGDVARAVELFGGALELDPKLALDPTAKAGTLAAPGSIAEGRRLVKRGSVKEAIAAFTRAAELDPKVDVPAQAWDDLCRFGSLWGHPREVLTACSRAVTLDPKNAAVRDSRGLARALSGDRQGAIDDFEAFCAWRTPQLRSRMGLQERKFREEQIAERQRWIMALRDRGRPFTREVIEALRKP